MSLAISLLIVGSCSAETPGSDAEEQDPPVTAIGFKCETGPPLMLSSVPGEPTTQLWGIGDRQWLIHDGEMSHAVVSEILEICNAQDPQQLSGEVDAADHLENG